MHRPLGVALLAIRCVIMGGVDLWIAASHVPVPLGSPEVQFLVLTMLGVSSLIAAVALWQMDQFGRVLTSALFAFDIWLTLSWQNAMDLAAAWGAITADGLGLLYLLLASRTFRRPIF